MSSDPRIHVRAYTLNIAVVEYLFTHEFAIPPQRDVLRIHSPFHHLALHGSICLSGRHAQASTRGTKLLEATPA